MLPFVKVDFEGKSFSLLIDTGSSICLLSYDIFLDIKQSQKPKYLSRSVRIQTVNGSGVRFVSCVELTLKLGGQKLKQVFYVSKDIRGNNLSGIIGCDFIRDNNVSIHLQEQFISLSGLKIPFLGCTERVNTVVVTELPASLVNKQIIGPGETRVLKLRIRQHFVDGTDVLFTPNSKNVHLEIHVAVHKVFCSEFYVIVVNLGCKHMHLNKGMCLGTVTPEFSIRDSERETCSVNLIRASNEVKEMRRRELKATDFELGHLTKEQKNRVLTVLLEHSEVFSKSLKTLGHTDHIVPR
ncbi:hypothetical protein JTE90_007701 [Oedothorax gibbosus]|uniref:Peptidase A2 domain-containing protein n=1 Tax=Oedothorax gibbosus TaxID=931172 RepID=A0AAV6TIS5_9ARAC|nr:hypothetical protein JTE90_007701 [Oedothorax gibbosus]